MSQGFLIIWANGRRVLSTVVIKGMQFIFTFGLSFRVSYVEPDIGLVVRVFANGLGDLGSIPGQVIPKSQKMVLDASL